jgi:hypothetical protein
LNEIFFGIEINLEINLEFYLVKEVNLEINLGFDLLFESEYLKNDLKIVYQWIFGDENSQWEFYKRKGNLF